MDRVVAGSSLGLAFAGLCGGTLGMVLFVIAGKSGKSLPLSVMRWGLFFWYNNQSETGYQDAGEILIVGAIVFW